MVTPARSAKRSICLLRVIAFAQCAGRAVRDALAAQRTVRLLDHAVSRNINGRARAGTADVPDGERLHLIAHLNAAHTLDTLIYITVERERGRPVGLFAACKVGGVGNTQNAHIVRDLLKLAGARADTGRALVVVLREDKLHIARRASSARGELVRITIPSRTTLLHEGTSLPSPSTSTQQTRQAEISFSSFK